jgi:RimJ/RimL family protein N-acetyltransferase
MVETTRLLLRPWREADAIIQRRLWEERDPRVPAHRRIDAEGRPTVAELEERIRSSHRSGVRGLLAIELRDSGTVIGYCGLVDDDSDLEGEPELAFELFKGYWGHGYATEAGTAVLKRARSAGYSRVRAGVRDWNVASRRVLAKLGFVETGGVERDEVHGDSLLLVRVF